MTQLMTDYQVLEFMKEEGDIDWIGKETAWSSKAMQQAVGRKQP